MMNNRNDLPKRIESIQLIRAFSAFTISLSHIPFTSENGWNIVFGVDIFLILTGFLEMYVIENDQEFSLRKFWIKKITRILPLYWIITIATFFASRYFGESLSITELLKSLLLIPYSKISTMTETIVVRPIVGPAHTLMYDMYFYIIYGIAAKISKKYRGIISSIVILMIYLCGRLIKSGNIYLSFYSNYWVINLIFGIALYYLYKRMRIKGENKDYNYLWIALSVISIYVFIYVSRIKISGSYNVVFKCIPAFIFVISVIKTFDKRHISKFFVRVGDISYSYYLIHYYCLFATQRIFGDFRLFSIRNLVLALVSLAIAETMALISWHLIERRLCDVVRNILLSSKD